MNILLIGEASNLHWTLAEGLRANGHSVTVISHGSHWLNNRRDISIVRQGYDLFHSVKYVIDIVRHLPQMRGYDIVQITNPIFFDLRPEKNLSIFKYLKKHNKKIFLDALATDHYYVKACLDRHTFKYSDFFIGNQPLCHPNREKMLAAWIGGPNEQPNIEMAQEANGIIACLYEYYAAYQPEYSEKLAYIPIPINLSYNPFHPIKQTPDMVKFFIGIQQHRTMIKGTDILLEVLQEVHNKYPKESLIQKVISVPFDEYHKLLKNCHVILDQLYSYTPATNALAAMARGMVAVSGAEPEFYRFIGEEQLRPIINVLPDRDDIFHKLENLITHREQLPQLSIESRKFVEKYHDHIKVAQQYLAFWEKH